MAFLHGIESLAATYTLTPIADIPTGVIGLIGTSEAGSPSVVNELKLCLSAKDDEQFGTTGSIPAALTAIRAQGPAIVLVVSLGPEVESPAYPVAVDFVGTDTGGVKTGLKVFELAYSMFGMNPKILIAPEYTALTGVMAALQTAALKHRAMCYIDSAAGLTVSAAITSRGTGNAWATSNARTMLMFGGVLDLAGAIKPQSAYAAGVRAQVDRVFGWWELLSNKIDMLGITGVETPITFKVNDETCEANLLNAQGIQCIMNTFGTGYKQWGNRNASYPTVSTPRSFESIQRINDIMDDAIDQTILPYVDRVINQGLIDFILDTINGYFNTLIGKGALIEGSKCYFYEADNSVGDIAAGKLTFTKVYAGGIPAERITFKNTFDINLLNNII